MTGAYTPRRIAAAIVAFFCVLWLGAAARAEPETLHICFFIHPDTCWNVPKSSLSPQSGLPNRGRDFIRIYAEISPTERLDVDIHPGRNFLTGQFFAQSIQPRLKYLARMGDLDGFQYPYQVATGETYWMTVFSPTLASARAIYFECPPQQKICNAHTDFSERVVLKYAIPISQLKRWKEVDERIHALVASFQE